MRVAGVRDVSYNEDSASLISSAKTTDGLRYTVSSIIPFFTPALLNTAAPVDGTSPKMRRYLQLPDIPDDVRALAEGIVNGMSTQYDKALALQNYLRTGYTYSLNVRFGHSRSAIREFLLGPDKKGYCEQFAGSYAVMARALGLPTRVAVGFTSGEVTQDGRYKVQNRQAHAWPEVFFPNIGWAAFEPTPGRSVPNGAAYTGISDGGDGATSPEGSTAATITEAPAATPQVPTTQPNDSENSATKETLSSTSNNTSAVVGLGVFALMALLGVAWAIGVPALHRLVRDRRRAAAIDPVDRVLVAWHEANEALGITGHARQPHETFREHARRAGAAAKLDPNTHSALVGLASDATWANYVDAVVEPSVAYRSVEAAAVVERALMGGIPKMQQFLHQINPRPLVSRRHRAREAVRHGASQRRRISKV